MIQIDLEKEIKNNYKSSNQTNKVFAIILIIAGLIILPFIIRNGLSPDINSKKILVSWIGILFLPLIPVIGGILVLSKITKQISGN